jgi:hypothetical protein
MTKGQKLQTHNEVKKRFQEASTRLEGPSERGQDPDDQGQFPAVRTIGHFGDRWILHPLLTMNEPEKALCYLTARAESELTEDGFAAMYLYGSLNGEDRFPELVGNAVYCYKNQRFGVTSPARIGGQPARIDRNFFYLFVVTC